MLGNKGYNLTTLAADGKPVPPLILIRQDTAPEDIKEISQADGLLTARGGQTSHASLVALRLDKTCVVGCKNLKVYETEERCEIGEHVIRFGDPISIDGRKGLFLWGDASLEERGAYFADLMGDGTIGMVYASTQSSPRQPRNDNKKPVREWTGFLFTAQRVDFFAAIEPN